MKLRRIAATICCAVLACSSSAATWAQAYPTKPVRVIVPYPPGGGLDFAARLVTGKMTESTGQQFLIDNRPGASGIVGAEALIKSAPDGYTIFVGDLASLSLNPILYAKLPYDPFKDFAPIGRLLRAALMLVVPADSPINSVKDLVDRAKANPGKMNYGIPGVGAPHHLTMELFLLTTGAKMTHVAFKGAAPAVQELVSGRLDAMFSDLGSGGPQVRGGKLKGLAVAHATRMPQFPNVPTVAESGYAGFDAFAWSGVVAPAGTPREIVERLNAEMTKAWNDPSVQQKLGDVGFESMPGPPDALPPFMRAEQAKWRKVIDAAQIKVE